MADVAPDALALARGKQEEKAGWASRFRGGEGGGEAQEQARLVMCGIIGIIGKSAVSPHAAGCAEAAGIPRLRFRRGRDAGERVDRAAPRRGQARQPRGAAGEEPLAGTTGIGHTRWATHGAPNETNAHPHATERVAVVHNGIIENFAELQRGAGSQGLPVRDADRHRGGGAPADACCSIAGKTPEQAMAATLKRFEGAFALAVLLAGRDDLLLAARRGSPLAVGYGERRDVSSARTRWRSRRSRAGSATSRTATGRW